MTFFHEYILHNWHLKLLSLLLAFLLWSVITGEPPAEVGFTVPLELQNIPQGLVVAGDVPASVQVRLHGPAALVRRLSPGNIIVAIDLTGHKVGEHWFSMNTGDVVVPYGVRVVRVSPAQIRLRLEPARAPSPQPR